MSQALENHLLCTDNLNRKFHVMSMAVRIRFHERCVTMGEDLSGLLECNQSSTVLRREQLDGGF